MIHSALALPLPLRAWARQAWRDSSLLVKCLLLSLLLHALLLAVRIVQPAAFDIYRTDQALDVVLVNARSAKAPRAPTALAQAHLDGGGEHHSGRASTPLPAQTQVQDGDAVIRAQQRVQFLEEAQHRLLTRAAKSDTQMQTALPRTTAIPTPPLQGQDVQTLHEEIARLEAEIARDQQHYAKRPKRAQLTAASTREVVYAQYYDAVRRKVEAWGTAHFPHHQGQPLYGELILAIAIHHSGALGYHQDGYVVQGVEVQKSSGNRALDRQARAIVQAAAPFGVFSENMRRQYDMLELIATFKFTRQGMETRLQAP